MDGWMDGWVGAFLVVRGLGWEYAPRCSLPDVSARREGEGKSRVGARAGFLVMFSCFGGGGGYMFG